MASPIVEKVEYLRCVVNPAEVGVHALCMYLAHQLAHFCSNPST